MRPTSRPLYLGPGPLQAKRSPSSRRRPRATVACPLGSYEEQQRIGGALEASARLGRQHHPPIKPIVCVPRLRFPRHFRRARTTSRNNDREQGSGALRPPHLAHRRFRSSLSLILTENEDIEALCALVHLRQANAVMQVVFDPTGGGPQIGLVVSKISPKGWKALRIQLGEDQWRRWRISCSTPGRDMLHDRAGEQA